jgi:hypothetical protein
MQFKKDRGPMKFFNQVNETFSLEISRKARLRITATAMIIGALGVIAVIGTAVCIAIK